MERKRERVGDGRGVALRRDGVRDAHPERNDAQAEQQGAGGLQGMRRDRDDQGDGIEIARSAVVGRRDDGPVAAGGHQEVAPRRCKASLAGIEGHAPAVLHPHRDAAQECVPAGRANVGDNLLTLVASALAGGDCIADADAMRAGGAGRVLGCTVKAPPPSEPSCAASAGATSASSTASAAHCSPAAGRTERDQAPRRSRSTSTRQSARPTASAKEGARHPGYTGARGYHPLLAVAAGTGDVLMARLREGRANTARGAAHFLRETVARVRDAGASGQLTCRPTIPWSHSLFPVERLDMAKATQRLGRQHRPCER